MATPQPPVLGVAMGHRANSLRLLKHKYVMQAHPFFRFPMDLSCTAKVCPSPKASHVQCSRASGLA